MDNDLKAVRNQKVFVQLDSVMEVQEKYLAVRTEFTTSEAELQQLLKENRTSEDATRRYHAVESRLATLRTRKQAFEQVIRTLGLPIAVPLR